MLYEDTVGMRRNERNGIEKRPSIALLHQACCAGFSSVDMRDSTRGVPLPTKWEYVQSMINSEEINSDMKKSSCI